MFVYRCVDQSQLLQQSLAPAAAESDNPEEWKAFQDPHQMLNEAMKQLADDDW